MAKSDIMGGRSSGDSELQKLETPLSNSIKIADRRSRRQWALVGITVCLNVLLWSSMVSLIASFYLAAADAGDQAVFASVVMSIVSSLASIGYVITHSIFFTKQRARKHRKRHSKTHRKTTYIAVRFAVTLCTLWLLTTGWNVITVARRPVCLSASNAPRYAGWEAGTTCSVFRLAVAFSTFALMSSFMIFGTLASLRRPFEAHVFRYRCKMHLNPYPTPAPSRHASWSRLRSRSFATVGTGPEPGEKAEPRTRTSQSTHRTHTPTASETDIPLTVIRDLDLNTTPTTSPAASPSPIRALGLGIFTSDTRPPPLPLVIPPPVNRTSVLSRPSAHLISPSQPILSWPLPTHTPSRRISFLVLPATGPSEDTIHFSPSTWRAVHPHAEHRLPGSNPHLSLPCVRSVGSFAGSRGSVVLGLTRPARLSTYAPVCEGYDGSAGDGALCGDAESGGHSLEEEDAEKARDGELVKRASAGDIAFALVNGTAIPGTEDPSLVDGEDWVKMGSGRRASAPDAGCGASAAGEKGARMGKGWKPRLAGAVEGPDEEQEVVSKKRVSQLKLERTRAVMRSFSVEVLGGKGTGTED